MGESYPWDMGYKICNFFLRFYIRIKYLLIGLIDKRNSCQTFSIIAFHKLTINTNKSKSTFFYILALGFLWKELFPIWGNNILLFIWAFTILVVYLFVLSNRFLFFSLCFYRLFFINIFCWLCLLLYLPASSRVFF